MRWETRIGRQLKLRDLHILLTVVQCGSMAKAAAQLAISQPAVSKAIADMEHSLRVRLLERSPQGIEPTRYGEALVRRSDVVFNELGQGVKEIEFLADPTVGELRIGATDPFAAAVLAPIMNRLSQQHSRVSFHVVTGDLTTLLGELNARNIELGMSRWSDTAGLNGMTTEILFEDAYVVVAGVQNQWLKRRKIQLSDLLDEPWVLPPYDTFQGRLNVAAFCSSGIEPPRQTVATLSLNLRNTLLATGRFLTILPSFALHLSDRNLQFRALALDLPKTRRPVGIIRLRNRSLSPLAELFVENMRTITAPLRRPR
jgi:DNA-binding transcriptional LysR family regulator